MPKTLKIGCGEWGFRDLPMEEHFRLCREFGFKTMEFGIGGDKIGRLGEYPSDEEIASFLKTRAQYGIATPFCCIENDFTLPDAAAHEQMVDKVLRQMRIARQLGATHVRLFAGFTPASRLTGDIWTRMLDAIGRCAALGAEIGLQISLETHGRITAQDGAAIHEHTVTTEPASLRRLVAALPANVGFNYDPGNIKATAPNDRQYCLDIVNGHINYCHLKDWRRKGAGWTAVAPGDDDLDYGDLLSRMSYDGVCLIEYEPTEDVVDGIRRSLDYLKRVTNLQFA